VPVSVPSHAEKEAVLRPLRTLYNVGAIGDLTDCQLPRLWGLEEDYRS
jgi:hypothetical protein